MKKHPFWTAALFSLGILVVLTSVAMVEPPKYRRSTDTLLKRVWRTLSKDELNREARERDMVAYYEGLLNESSRVSAMNTLLSGRSGTFDMERWDGLGRRLRKDFRNWDYEPGFVNRDLANPDSDLVVNSHGMADHEYGLEKPGDAWRIALLGDSVTRGQGTPMFRNYESLLEDRLNNDRNSAARRIEILNFAVGGYRITQLVDVATSWASKFQPDLYVLPLSRLSVIRRWNDHLSSLVQNEIDLKYGFLKQIVADSGFRPQDSRGTADAKLARFRFPVIEWSLRTIREQAGADGARLVIILLPNGTEPEQLQEEFVGVREVIRDVGVPMIDLLDAFEEFDDLNPYRVSATDMHPNEQGHQVLADRLHNAIANDPAMTALFTGSNDKAWPVNHQR